MKKGLLILLIFVGLIVICTIETNGVSTNSLKLSLFKEAQACTASVECFNGQTISCSGNSWCQTFANMAVFCDGNQSIWCY